MKTVSLLILLAITSLTFLTAQSTFELKESKITIEGTSTMHDWVSNVTEVKATGKLVTQDGALQDIQSLKVEIAVLGIKSEKGKTMDKKTWKALKEEAFPTITYQLKAIRSIEPEDQDYKLQTTGVLEIAGKAIDIDMAVTASLLNGQGIRFEGSKDLKMTGFEIDPPTAMFGALKTGDDITIRFRVTLVSKGSL